MKGKKGFRSGVSYKSYYKLYDWDKNTERMLKRHIKANPNDETAKQALNRLDRMKKKYTRDRLSNGHICKAHPDLVTSIAAGDDRLSIVQQMENIGHKYRGRRNNKTTRQGMGRVR